MAAVLPATPPPPEPQEKAPPLLSLAALEHSLHAPLLSTRKV